MISSNTCKTHNQKPKYICMHETCNKESRLICGKCIITSHKEHIDHCVFIKELSNSTQPIVENYPKNEKIVEIFKKIS